MEKTYALVSADVLRLVCDTAALRGKAAVNALQSRRCAMFEDGGPASQRLECGALAPLSETSELLSGNWLHFNHQTCDVADNRQIGGTAGF